MNSMSRKIILFLTILPILSIRSDDMENAKKCAEELPGLYDTLCEKVSKDGEKVIAVKKKCIEYPDKLKALPEVVKEFEKCNEPPKVCNKTVMKQCGEDHYKIADDWYQNSKIEGKAANLADLAMNDMANVNKVCEKSKACIKEEIAALSKKA